MKEARYPRALVEGLRRWATSGERAIFGHFIREHAFGRPRFPRAETGAVTEQRGAIRTDDLVRISQIEINMRMVEWRQLADAHEFPRADFDHRHASRVVKVGNDRFGHGSGGPN